jgi:hypothetical protein
MPDLSNAIIANCKHYTWEAPVAPPPAPPNAGATDPAAGGDLGDAGDAGAAPLDPAANPEEDPNAGPAVIPEYIPPLIYDPVMHKSGDSVASGSSIPTSEHQITQHPEGSVDDSMADTAGPRGDWHVSATHHSHAAGTQWEALPAENLETNFVPKDQIVSATFGQNDVTDIVKTAYSNGQREFKGEDAIFPDSKPDTRKGLTVKWIHDGETGSGVSPKGADRPFTIPDNIPASVVANDGVDINAGSDAVAPTTGTK